MKPRTARVCRLGWYEKRPAIVEGVKLCAEVGRTREERAHRLGGSR